MNTWGWIENRDRHCPRPLGLRPTRLAIALPFDPSSVTMLLWSTPSAPRAT